MTDIVRLAIADPGARALLQRWPRHSCASSPVASCLRAAQRQGRFGILTVILSVSMFSQIALVGPGGDIAAASAVVTVPLIVLVLFFQRHIIEG